MKYTIKELENIKFKRSCSVKRQNGWRIDTLVTYSDLYTPTHFFYAVDPHYRDIEILYEYENNQKEVTLKGGDVFDNLDEALICADGRGILIGTIG